GAGGLLGGEQIERVQGGGDRLTENLGKLKVLRTEGAWTGALDVEGADNAVAEAERHGERAVGTWGAGDVKGVGFRVGTEVTLAGGGDEAGHAIILGQGVKFARGSLRDHAVVKEGHELAGRRIEQPDGDQLVVQ